jgi:hypothetical protein
MKRIYLKRTGNLITIMNRNTHELLGFLSIEDREGAKKAIKDICNMSTEEYIQYALGLGVRFSADKHKKFIVNEDSEKWYEGAWATTTTHTLKELGMKDNIPDDEITPSLVEEVKKAMKESKGTPVRAKKPLPKKREKPEVKQPVEVVKEEKPQELTNVVELKEKKVKKALPKKKTEPKKNSLKEEYENGGMTIREYLRKRRESSEGVVR